MAKDESRLDSKGRIVISDSLRKRMGLRKGSKVKMHKTKESIIITKSVDPDEFIAELQGFLKKGSKIPRSDPLKLKEIWPTN